jgi:hypothetical protein
VTEDMASDLRGLLRLVAQRRLQLSAAILDSLIKLRSNERVHTRVNQDCDLVCSP